ncbi:MAG: phage tail protein I [Candidatus Aminicenantes bacterium]|nr:phage tail protein I [Candidatus Aminicenantes bacterium]NIM83163.1 phage tail protein I [Candidatus Aminicenantes bacterium]NIN22539.1 phage tail protein I [Candidatus Aminicenantes bacterium]NIN46310.1 phage tail protein I [Candidatus Aminicenantes bacterium]NIN89149.1 phage tail protein I [Candidatus Aminicenantes bacterium]
MNRKSSYLDYLPEIYRETEFTGRFLKIFEKILTGIDDGIVLERPGIEQLLDNISDYFDAASTPFEFLEWLASWVALELPEDWPEEVKRNLIPEIVQLYKKRGTLEGLEAFLKIYAGPGVTINEWLRPFQIGDSSTIGESTALDGGPPDYFKVTVILPEPDVDLKIKKEKAVRAIIDREKPAHTYYDLEVIIPTLQIEVHSTIDVDTLLG